MFCSMHGSKNYAIRFLRHHEICVATVTDSTSSPDRPHALHACGLSRSAPGDIQSWFQLKALVPRSQTKSRVISTWVVQYGSSAGTARRQVRVRGTFMPQISFVRLVSRRCRRSDYRDVYFNFHTPTNTITPPLDATR